MKNHLLSELYLWQEACKNVGRKEGNKKGHIIGRLKIETEIDTEPFEDMDLDELRQLTEILVSANGNRKQKLWLKIKHIINFEKIKNYYYIIIKTRIYNGILMYLLSEHIETEDYIRKIRYEEGIEIGKQKAEKEIISKMLKTMTPKEISQITEIPQSSISKIAKEE